MAPLSLNDQVALAVVLIALLVLLLALALQSRRPSQHLRKVTAIEDVETLMYESAEKGQRLAIGLGPNLLDRNSSVAGLNGLPLLRAISKRSVFNDQPSQSLSGDGTLACLSQMIVRGVYQDTLATEFFKADYGLMIGVTPFAYLAGLLPEVNYHTNAGVILSGQFRPETILALDLAERKNLPVIAMSDSLSAQAVLFASSAQVCLGEDCFSTNQINKKSPIGAASLVSQDVLRILIALGLLAGAVLKLVGVLP